MNWEKKFDKKFHDHKDDWNVSVIGYGVTTMDMKRFISKEIIEKIIKDATQYSVDYKAMEKQLKDKWL